MSEAKVDVKIERLVDGADMQEVIAKIASAFNRDTDAFKARLQQSIEIPETATALQKGVSREAAEQACKKLENLGLKCKIEEQLSINFEVIQPKFLCPACGHEQQPTQGGDDVCSECGVVASKYAANASKAKIYDSEKRRLENQRQVQEQDAQDAQERKQEEALRDQIREQLGVKKPSPKPATKAAIGGLIAIACGVIFYTQSSYFSSPEATEGLNPSLASQAQTATETAANSPKAPQAGKQKSAVVTDMQRVAQIQALVSSSDTMGAASQFAQVDENFDEALEAYEAISSPDEQMVAIGSITDSLQSLPDPSRSLKKLETHVASTQGNNRKVLEQKIVEGWLNADNDGQAINFVSSIEHGYDRETALLSILDHQVANPKTADATQQTIKSILHQAEKQNAPSQEARLYSAISRAYALMGKEAESEKFLDLAFTQTDLILQLEDKIEAYCQIAEDRMEINDEELGLHLYQNATELAFGLSKYNAAKPAALRSLALSQARIGNFLDAREAADEIKHRATHIKTLGELAKLAKEAKKLNLAKSFLSQANTEMEQIKNTKEHAKLKRMIATDLDLIALAE